MIKSFFKQDFILTTCIIFLSLIGILSIFSTNQSYIGVRQSIFVIAGLILYFIIMSIDYKLYRQKLIQVLAYAIIAILLILIYVLNIKANNTYRWFTLGSIDVQPAEFAKIVVILVSASFFTFFRKVKNPLKKIFLGFLIIAPILLLVYKQPALGTSIVIFVIWLSIVFASYYDQIKFIYILLLFLLSSLIVTAFLNINVFNANINLIFININIVILLSLILLIFILYRLSRKKINTMMFISIIMIGLIFGSSFKFIVWDHLMKNYQRQRIVGFLTTSPNVNNTENFQVTQSKIAIGSGGFYGEGYAKGTQSILNFLPEDTTDFIYSTFIQEFGFIGNIILMFIYFILIYRLINILNVTKNRFSTLIIFGILTMIIFQFVINVGMNLGMMPITGIPLPLVSYGGSALFTVLILLGISQNIYLQDHETR
ncbi:rod shape-determining protein RodA [Patescibacteria group bacterium]|nr:rod shape-determining protein RodA [Patescibacteria group bacterium]